MRWATTRARMSVGPPAGNGTTMRIGRVGNALAVGAVSSAADRSTGQSELHGQERQDNAAKDDAAKWALHGVLPPMRAGIEPAVQSAPADFCR